MFPGREQVTLFFLKRRWQRTWFEPFKNCWTCCFTKIVFEGSVRFLKILQSDSIKLPRRHQSLWSSVGFGPALSPCPAQATSKVLTWMRRSSTCATQSNCRASLDSLGCCSKSIWKNNFIILMQHLNPLQILKTRLHGDFLAVFLNTSLLFKALSRFVHESQ